jgi:hypothetical protein
MEARTMALLLAPKPIVFQRLASLRAQQERERDKGRPSTAGHDEAHAGLEVDEDDLHDEEEEAEDED